MDLISVSGNRSPQQFRQVSFTNSLVSSYCVETAIEEGKHVLFLRSALGSYAVAQPSLELQTSFSTLATAAGIASPFDPFDGDADFWQGPTSSKTWA